MFGNFVEHVREVTTQEDGKNGRGSFGSTEAVAVSGTHNRGAEKVLVLVHHHQYIHHKGEEEHVAFCSLGR